MASALKMEEQIVCQELLESGTSIILTTERQRLGTINVQVSQKITLVQEPNETLTLDLTLQTGVPCISCDFFTVVSCSSGSIVSGYRNHLDPGVFCGHCGEKGYPDHYVDLSLKFENILHEVSQDYGYAIEVKALITDANNDSLQRHVLLFTHKEIRTKNVINFFDQPNMYNIETASNDLFVNHICIDIIRFNKNKNDGEKKDLASTSEMLLRNGFCSDVSLVVGDKIFPAHKNVLSSKSDVFKAMFTYMTIENQEGVVNIHDFDAEVIEEMLWYVYTNKTKNLDKIAQDVFGVANKYQIHGLKAKCVEYFVFNLNYSNVIDILDLATLYDLQDLKNNATAFMCNHEEQMAKEDSYQKFLCRDLSANTIAHILELCEKYKMEAVKLNAFEYIKNHNSDVSENKEYLELLYSHPSLMRDIYLFIQK